MKNYLRMPIIVIPGKGHITIPQFVPAPVIQPGNNQEQSGQTKENPNFTTIPEKSSYEDENRLIIKIKSVFVGRFVQIGFNSYLYATGEYFSDGQVFIMILQGRNQVKIRVSGGNFIRIDNNGFLIADVNNIEASIFNIYNINQYEYVIMAPNGYYVSVMGRDSLLIAGSKNIESRIIFRFRKL